MTGKANLSDAERRAIFAKHGNGSALSIHDIKSKKKVCVKEPDFIEHRNLIIARGKHPKENRNVSQIVHVRK